MTIHPSAIGFHAAANDYERGRPEFPAEATAFLAAQLRLTQATVALDIGAGTGKLARALLRSGTKVIALEPVEGMRNMLAALLAGTWLIGAVAEQIPLRSCLADAAVAGNAFHWFANPSALAEIKRVLKPGGRLGLLWTWLDESVAWVAELSRMVDRHQGSTPRYPGGGWMSALERFGGFRKVAHRSFRFVRTGGFEIVSNHILSVSFIAKMGDRDRQRLVQQARNLVEAHPATRGCDLVELPYCTEVYIYDTTREIRRPAAQADGRQRGSVHG